MTEIKRELRVVHLASGEVVKSIDVTGQPESRIERIEMGLLRNMNMEEYGVDDTATHGWGPLMETLAADLKEQAGRRPAGFISGPGSQGPSPGLPLGAYVRDRLRWEGW